MKLDKEKISEWGEIIKVEKGIMCEYKDYKIFITSKDFQKMEDTHND